MIGITNVVTTDVDLIRTGLRMIGKTIDGTNGADLIRTGFGMICKTVDVDLIRGFRVIGGHLL
jgi:hypothetical protein